MKNLIAVLLLLFAVRGQSQTPNTTYYNWVNGADFGGKVKLPSDTAANAKDGSMAIIGGLVYFKNGYWKTVGAAPDSAQWVTRYRLDSLFALTIKSSDSTIKFVTPFQADQKYVQIQTKPPTAGATPVSGSGTMEYTSTVIGGTDTSFTDNGSYGRQAGDATTSATANISAVVYDGANQSFTQPAVGSSNSFTKSVTVTKNVNKLVACTVTTTDGKQASANFTHSWLPRRYRGWVSDTSGIGTPAFANSIIWALTSELSSSKIWSFNTSAPPAGGGWYVIVTWGTTGAPTGITFNNNPAIDAMNIVQRSFTNQRAYTDNWYFTWNKNKQTASSDVSIQ